MIHDEKSLELVRHIDTLASAKKGHLPSCLVSLGGGSYDYVAGPKLSKNSPASICTTFKNETAVFVFPWETGNAFHSLNDNTFAVLSQVLLHRLLHAQTPAVAPYHVYSFARSTPAKSTTMFQLLFFLFSDNNVLSSTTSLLSGGPNCLQSSSWGSPVKVFYFDSLFNFRAEQYVFLRTLLETSIPQLPRPSERKNRPPKVVIVSRRDTAVVGRKLSHDSEQRLADVFRAQGAEVIICCDFAQLNTVEKVVATFWDVDICVGVHGAGMINCVFGRPGLVVVELQNHHAYGLETFMRMAHMARGNYIFYDVRQAHKVAHEKVGGAHLNQSLVQRIVATSLALHRFSQRHLALVEARMHPHNMTVPNATLLHRHRRDYLVDSSRLFAYKPPLTGAQIGQRWYSHELVVDFRTRRVYHDRHPLLEEFLGDDLQRQLRRGNKEATVDVFTTAASASYRPIGHALESLSNLDKEQSVQQRFTETKTKRRRRNASFSHIDGGFTYSAEPDHEELWIFFHPALFEDFQRASPLGPLFDDAYDYCVRLPFFKVSLPGLPPCVHHPASEACCVRCFPSAVPVDDAVLGRASRGVRSSFRAPQTIRTE